MYVNSAHLWYDVDDTYMYNVLKCSELCLLLSRIKESAWQKPWKRVYEEEVLQQLRENEGFFSHLLV